MSYMPTNIQGAQPVSQPSQEPLIVSKSFITGTDYPAFDSSKMTKALAAVGVVDCEVNYHGRSFTDQTGAAKVEHIASVRCGNHVSPDVVHAAMNISMHEMGLGEVANLPNAPGKGWVTHVGAQQSADISR